MITSQILKNMRLRAGLTQRQVGEQLKVSDMTISRYETGKIIPNFETVMQIAKICGFNIQFVCKDRVLTLKEMLREY